MSLIRDDFNTRVSEIDKYFDFLKHLEDDVKILNNHDSSITLRLDDDHHKIFKANGFLLLYNLIESTVLNAVTAIFDEINVKGLGYKDLIIEIKKYWFKYKYKHDDNSSETNIYNKFHIIVEDIITDVALETINKLEYGGSIDNRRMKDIAESLGMSFTYPSYNKDTHGEALVEIKKRRNHLAHGDFSFANLGKDYTYYGSTRAESDGSIKYITLGMQHYKQFTIEHLDKYIECVESYIMEEKFKLVI